MRAGDWKQKQVQFIESNRHLAPPGFAVVGALIDPNCINIGAGAGAGQPSFGDMKLGVTDGFSFLVCEKVDRGGMKEVRILRARTD